MSTESWPHTEMPLPQDPAFDIEFAGMIAVDQVIVDGLVDGQELRAPLKAILSIMLRRSASPSQFVEAPEVLRSEPRFIDEVTRGKKTYFGYEPVIPHETLAVPSLRAIIAGTAVCEEEQTQAAFAYMSEFAESLFKTIPAGNNSLDVRSIRRTLGAAGHDISYNTFGAFLKFMEVDHRFNRVPNTKNRVIVNGGEDGLEHNTTAAQQKPSSQPDHVPLEVVRTADSFEKMLNKALGPNHIRNKGKPKSRRSGGSKRIVKM